MRNPSYLMSELKRVTKLQAHATLFLGHLKHLEYLFTRGKNHTTTADECVLFKEQAHFIINQCNKTKFFHLFVKADVSFGDFETIYDDDSIPFNSDRYQVTYREDYLHSKIGFYTTGCSIYREELKPAAKKLYRDTMYIAYISKFDLPSELQLEIVKHLRPTIPQYVNSIQDPKVCSAILCVLDFDVIV